MITQKIVCDNCEVEMRAHVYFVAATSVYFVASPEMLDALPDESALIRHACGDRCLMNLLSEWTINRKKRVNLDDDNGIDHEAKP